MCVREVLTKQTTVLGRRNDSKPQTKLSYDKEKRFQYNQHLQTEHVNVISRAKHKYVIEPLLYYIYIYIYIYIYTLRGLKTSGDAFRLPHSFASDCSIRPFLDLFHSWLYISHLSTHCCIYPIPPLIAVYIPSLHSWLYISHLSTHCCIYPISSTNCCIYPN
jgi:hypothetical protein